MKKAIAETRFKVFIENARLLSEQEISEMPEEKRSGASQKYGLWIEVACPEGTCSVDKDKITLPASGLTEKETKGVWLRLFCPGNQCAIEETTDLP
jgi:hypothetical protein